MNRIRIKATDGKWYWYNPNTKRLFKSMNGNDEIFGFSYKNGILALAKAVGHGTRGGPSSYSGGGTRPPASSTPHGGERSPDTPGGNGPDPCPPGWKMDYELGACVPDTEPDPDDPCPPGWHLDADTNMCVKDEEEEDDEDSDDDGIPDSGEDAYDILINYLSEWGLESLSDFVKQAIIEGKSAQQVLMELRRTPEYAAAFPEQAEREKNGYGFMPESQILAYREEARRISQMYGINPDASGIVGLIGNNVSLNEWERRLDTWTKFKAWGPTVRSVLEEELGRRITDDEAFAFLSNDISTPDLDKAYEDALYRGRPAILGLGVRPDEEAELLRRYGVDVDQAFRGYQGILNEMPSAERYAAIETNINQGVDAGNLPSTGSALFNDTPFSLLFRAIQLNDGTAIQYLRSQMDREIARFSVGGGAAMAGTQAIGLSERDER